MIKFIKNLLGFGAQETVKEIVTPPAYNPPKEVVITRILAPASNPDVIVTPVVNKPQPGKKVKAISVPITEGSSRANVKKPNPNNAKPSAPPAPKTKAKNKSKPKSKK
jgi:hypothetical protein